MCDLPSLTVDSEQLSWLPRLRTRVPCLRPVSALIAMNRPDSMLSISPSGVSSPWPLAQSTAVKQPAVIEYPHEKGVTIGRVAL